MTAPRRRLIVAEIGSLFRASQRRVARALGVARSSLRYTPVRSDEQAALMRRIEELAVKYPRFGYRRIWDRLVREGWSVNKKAVENRCQFGMALSEALVLCQKGFAKF